MKSIHINEKTHNYLKIHCNDNGLKINYLVETLIKKYLNENDNIEKYRNNNINKNS